MLYREETSMSCNCSNDEAKSGGNAFDEDEEMEAPVSLDENGNVRRVSRSGREMQDMIRRLNRIEGQVRGVRKMLEDERYCVDILAQVASIQAALNGFNKQLLANHIRSCVCDDIRAGRDEAVDELCDILKKLMK